MARTRSVDFLPEIFRTPVNKQFLAATLDQMVQEPKFKKTQGFIGRTVGPGVNPNDKYVVEPDKSRQEYQLEPGVISLEPDTQKIKNAITYPGMNDAIGFQGGDSTRADQLYNSDYYTWDPFVDYDAFINFSQYFWLPSGPDTVDVKSLGVPTNENFVVTRENGVYTFSGLAGDNPTIDVVRGGSYTFQVAQNAKETVNYRVTNNGTASYLIDSQSNPALTLTRGNTYVFNITLNGVYPFWIKTALSLGTGDAYNSGVSRNGSSFGLVTFVVPQDAPDTLYYVSENQTNLRGTINIVDGTPGTGPGFWIQTAPGVDGVSPVYPNISDRDVYGVSNNGEDLGVISFNVPQKTAQQFYYDLTNLGTVDLLTELKFDQINNQPLDEFIATYGGIDGVSYLDTRTLVFTNPITDATDGGWLQTTFYDPLFQMGFTQPAGNRRTPVSIVEITTGADGITTFDFATELYPPLIGDRVVISGVTPSVYNGNYIVTDSSATSISVVNEQAEQEFLESLPIAWPLPGGTISVYGNYNSVTATSVTGIGINAVLNVNLFPGSNTYDTKTQIQVVSAGSNYAVGDILKITGDQIGGATPANDLTLVVTNIGQNGQVGSYDSTDFDQTSIVPINERYQIWQINIVDRNGTDYISLNNASNVGLNEKFTINYGSTYSNTNWYKNSTGYFQRIPLLTAVLNELYYQDGTDPEIFGKIRLLDQTDASTIFIDQIIGQKNYTSPNGVAFTNGLKVRFTGDVLPVSYGSGTTTFTCTATQAGSNYITCSSTVGLYEGEEIVFSGTTAGGIVAGQSYYIKSLAANGIQFSIATVADGATFELSTATVLGFTAVAIANNEFYVSGVGTAIELLPVRNFITPETYVVDARDSTIASEPGEVDYLTIDRASKDLNAWTRSNRWFHVDVIQASATYNNTVAVLDNNYRAKRPIINFRPNIRLYNFGTEAKQPVDIIDFSETDAFSNIEGSTGYAVDGYTFVDGSRVIFAADADPNVRDNIYVVQFITPDSIAPLIDQPIINLVLASDGNVLVDQAVVCLEGTTQRGISYWYDGAEWTEAQQKTGVQQAPLFNVYDLDGISFGNRARYPSSTFVGSKLFSYAVGDTGILDPILQFPLQYLNINNVGDIVFENNLYKDTFLYVLDNVSVTSDISTGAAREYADRTTFGKLIGWQTATSTSQQYQQFKFEYTGQTLKLDVAVGTTTVLPAIKIYVGSEFIQPNKYSYTIGSNSTTITLVDTYLPTDVIEVLVLSDQTSTVAFYQVPINLQNNPLNNNSPSFTLGTIRTQYESICENLSNKLVGPINGANNTRDLGNIGPYGLTILQQSSPLTLAGYFLRSETYNIFASLQYNSQEYLKFKGQLLNAVTQQVIQNQTAGEVLDVALADITLGRVESQPFYWSDMIPAGSVYQQTIYTISNTTGDTFDTRQVYNYTSANYLGMNVYLNNTILVRGRDYTVATDGPRIVVSVDLVAGDQLVLNEYSTTYGSFIPNTPSKLGLYPAYRPEIVVQKTSNGTQTVIIGHDGSVTKTFDDIRDSVLLEFETRIFNNLKLDGNPVPLTVTDVLPGQFRTTGYSMADINNVLTTDFLSYVAWNKLDYRTQDYSASNEFSWNYSGSQSKLDNDPLLGAWRGIYRYYYDTQQPEETPWEMLGFSIRPDWWIDNYGPGPYTQDNLVLWDDLEAGYVADPVAPYYLPKYARPGLTTVIPTGTEGELLSPFDSVVGTYNDTTFRKSWAVGDGGPVEASWWNSSAYPFAVMRLLALTRPAKFFALFADRDLYKFDTDLNQYLYNNRYRLNAKDIVVYGNGISKASYIDWIVDYNRQSGVDSTADLTADLSGLDVRLCYRMASFSDKQYIKIYTEKSSPNSTNTTFLIPDESYDLLLYKNQPFDRASYSSVVVQKVAGGYAVFGYSTSQPYFNVLQSQFTGQLQTYSSGGATVRVPTFYTDTVTQIPYGFIFANETSVSDFLLSYGKYLERQGLTFDDTANGYILNWGQMVNEFLYWSQQGWDEQALINLNPLAFKLSISRDQAVVDSIVAQTADNILVDQNKRELPTRNLIITRIDNTFTVEPATDQTLSYIDLKYTAYEHMIVLNNASVFGDLIYQPTTGARQSRLNLIAVTTTEWNGSVDAQGFILNQNNVEEWNSDATYTKGQIVKYKGAYWSAATIVQPTAVFNANDWIASDYTQIELGLLPNLANKADQLQNSYNINTANLETDNDLLSYGLIGFRPRQYMTSLNLDDVSQLNVYRQFLGSKGTILSAELFSQANLGKESADYTIYENWAVQRAVYGANANRSFFQLRLNRALLDSNPSLVQIINPQESSQADQTILVSDIWRQSYNITSPDILPTTITLPTDTALPSAGYVNLDDVDITVFDIDDTDSLSANINNIGVGTNIWVAKTNSYDWAIYRAESVPGTIDHICDNLDGTSLVIFSQQHNLTANDKLIIRFFDAEVNGVYTVLSVVDLNTVTIAFSFTGNRTVVNGTGLGFTLKTQRVAQASDILNLPYANTIAPGAKVWVDNNGADLWTVLQKEEVFTELTSLSPTEVDEGEQYGSSVAQAQNRFAALVGSPQYRFPVGATKWNIANEYVEFSIVYVSDPMQTEFFYAPAPVPQGISIYNTVYWTPYSLASLPRRGGVYVYVKQDSDAYAPISPLAPNDAVLSLDVLDVSGGLYNGETAARGYGTSVDFGNQTWAAAGAPGSLGANGAPDNGYATVIYKDPQLGAPGNIPYGQWQLLTSPNSITAPEKFGQSVAVSLDERWLYVGAPGANAVYAYGRVDWERQRIQTLGNGTTTNYFIGDTIKIDADTQLTVSVAGDEKVLGTDYTVVNSFTMVVFATAPAAGDAVEIIRTSRKLLDYQVYYGVAGTGGTGSNATFVVTRARGTVTVSVENGGTGYTTGNTITIPAASFGGGSSPANDITFSITENSGVITAINGTPTYTPPPLTVTFSLNEYFYTVDNLYSFSVIVDNVLQRPEIDYIFSGDSALGNDLTFLNSPAAGASILVRAEGYFQYAGTITNPASAAGDLFGYSISTSTDGQQVLIGAPNAVVNGDTQAGAVYVYNRDVQRFIYGTDGSTVAFTVLGSVNAPVSVSVNNTFLTNESSATPHQADTFSVLGNTVTINGNLQVGDIIEIETNGFALVQTISQDTVAEFSNYGYATDLCSYNCSLYVGVPNSSAQTFKGGAVERSVNQSRAFGITTNTVANAALTSGNTLRVNNQDVVVPSAWNNSTVYSTNTVVYNTASSLITTVYLSLQSVPAATALTNTSYWTPITTTTVTASAQVRALAAQINAEVPNVNATVDVAGYLTIAVKNSAAAPVGNKLQVAPGSVGTAFIDLGFETFVFTQTIVSPYPVDFAGFGASVSIDDSAVNLVVGAPRGTLYLITVFDLNTTVWDENATDFFDQVVQSGAVYTYDLVNSSSSSVTNPDKFVFGQQINNPDVQSYDQYGTAVNYTDGALFTGAPGNELGDSTMLNNYGRVFVSTNDTRVPAWTMLREEKPVVDVRLLNSVYSYDRITSTTTQYYDFFDPLQGKILGAARQNLDYIGAVDPASYNVGPVGIRGTTWGQDRVGETWWDTSTVRFIDPNQDDIVYASRRWGQTFPGSSVDVYQWIVSATPPAGYVGEGIPLNTTSYVINTVLSKDGVFTTEYYFWVRGITTTATQKGKTLPISTVASYIDNPRGSGITYLAPINSSTIALYNASEYIEAQDTIISIEFDKELTDDNVHVEYELVAQGREDAFISSNLYRKMQDSFCGVDTNGNLVPDINLGPAERYGVQFRPRQSMFADRFAALKNYLTRANSVLSLYPISESRQFTLLNSSEPEPSATTTLNGITTTNWNKRVANLEILGFQNLDLVPVGYRYLVVSDSSNRGLWTIYVVEQRTTVDGVVKVLQLSSVQNYDTAQYWSYINWYLPGYNSSSKIIAEIPTVSALDTLDVTVGSSVKVTANSLGKFEIYLRTVTGWDRVGLQDGTIEFSAELWDYALGRFGFDVEVFDAQYFDQEPVIETRKIIRAINEELFVDDLLIERNRSLTSMFNFVLSEFTAPEWLVKTSLIDVEHRIRSLSEFQNYSRDNQEFVLDYIQEVKPYHVQVREFNLRYNGFDQWFGDMSDFDVPAYYNTSLQVPQYTSPILLPYNHGTANNSETNNLSDLASNSTVWSSWPYSQWYNNYLLSLDSITVVETGSGYTEPPLVEIVANPNDPAPTVAAQATAVLNSIGQVVSVNVTVDGAGYRSTPTITFVGGNGSGAVAYPRMVNDVVRQFRTVIRYDRFQYQTSIQTWNSNGTYENGTLVRYNDRVWSAQNADGSSAVVGPTFDLENWVLVNAATYTYPGSTQSTGLTGVDRTMGLYVPGVNEYGLELPLLVDGVDYPGVQVWGEYFTGTEKLDANYQSEFADIYLGTRFSDINVDGGEFVGPYEGHAPEELINGAEYDTLDMRVYTRPGSDWQIDGHGFQLGTVRYTFEPGISLSYSWAGVVEHPFNLVVSDLTTGRVLVKNVDYTVNWQAETITIIDFSNVNTNDIISIDVYEIGGGSQLYRANYIGATVIADDNNIILPVTYKEIVNAYVFVNGDLVALPELQPYAVSQTWSQNNTYQSLDIVFNNNELTVISTNGDYDVITCNSTSALTVGQPIVFSGTTFGGIVAGQEYYVQNIANGTQFYICDIAGDATVRSLTTATGTMTGSPKGTYYRAIQTVPPGVALTNLSYWVPFIPSTRTKLTITAAITNTDGISVVVLGNANSIAVADTQETGNAIVLLGSTSSLFVGQTVTFSGYSLGGVLTETNYTILSIISDSMNAITITEDGTTEVALIDDTATWIGQTVAKFVPSNYQSWSTPVIETFIVDQAIIDNGAVTLDNTPIGTNPANMVVMINGLRILGPSGIEWIGDGTTSSFGLPQRLGASFSQASIDAPNDIQVWVDGVLQKQSFGAEDGTYSVTNYNGSNTPGRQVVFDTVPASGAAILISISTTASCEFAYDPSGPLFTSTLQISSTLNIGDTVEVITWNDTSQQNALTLTFSGPVQTGTTVFQDYDTTDYDSPTLNDPTQPLPGQFAYEVGTSTPTNDFDLLRLDVDASRLWVTLDGYRLFQGSDYTVDGQYLILSEGAISPAQTLIVTEFTNSIVPEAAAFRIFQDMRGVQATYRMTNATTTVLTQPLSNTADVIYVENVSALTEPNLPAGVFGVITVDGERIMYRNRDMVTNTVSGLQRGTAGTAAASHDIDALVYDIGRGNLLNSTYQDYVVKDSGLGDGTTAVFYAPSIDIADFGDSSTVYVESIEVYVGGIRQYNYSDTSASSEYRWIVSLFDPLAIEFIVDDTYPAPAAGSEVTILQRRGKTWYEPGVGTPSNGVALQETNTVAARFLCDR